MLSATFSTIQETVIDCKRDRGQRTRSPRAKLSPQNHEQFTSQSKQTKDASQQTEDNFSYSEHQMVPLLERYSKLLLEKIDHKINQS